LAALVVPSLEATRAGGAIHIDTAIRVDLASRAHTLASYQRLAGFAITREPLPRTRLGKYRRFLLPALYERARNGAALRKTFAFSAEDEALLRQPAAKQVYDILVKHYPHGQLGLDASPLIDLGIDSLEWISFGLELEDRLKLRLTEKEIGGIVTVRDLLNLVIQAPVSTISPSSPPRDWIGPTGPGLRSLGVLLYALNWLVMHALFRLRVDGVENVPPHRNVIFVANHASYLDPSAIAAALSYRVARPTYWAGDPTLLFSKSWQEPFMRAMHCFPADERAPAQTLSVSETLLRQGYNLVWFPEGWRSPDGQLQPFLPGIGHLLMRSPVPVVPIYIEGAFEALPRDRTMPRLRKIQVFFGKPIQPADWEGLHMDKTDAPKKIANFLQRAIDTLDRKATLLDHN
jgi:long-chain acyl-CoA synthetase